ncbi:histidinol phosphate phosphatase [Massilia sp. WF1]|uniref:H-NS histone family protein n=1 Tax=unclassified Massilia TaxID=2609279 RepID=UPI00064A6D99|nr:MULTISPECIES: H-NS histone family protein [unclassified Massilia]ALK99519.1 histidinol phosphate phosphatase [Massilia sp. WG5]KLU38252.1 histidinol phosphate phosphatase [Massilia sp. WF1]
MAKTDLSNYNLAELKGLQFDIEKEIKSRQHDEVKKARERILAIAQDVGVPVEDLIAKASGGKKGGAKRNGGQQGQARYRNPADESQTWTGRGRQPKWVAEGLAGGKSLDDFRI